MRGALALVGLVACASATRSPRGVVRDFDGPDGAAPDSASVDAASAPSVDGGPEVDAGLARRSNPEVAWLVAHLADDPIPTRPTESVAGRRLISFGAEAVVPVVEVFRVADLRRVPFARRVIASVVLRQCGGDAARAHQRIASWSAPYDGGTGLESLGTRWPAETVERLRAWALRGAPCDVE